MGYFFSEGLFVVYSGLFSVNAVPKFFVVIGLYKACNLGYLVREIAFVVSHFAAFYFEKRHQFAFVSRVCLPWVECYDIALFSAIEEFLLRIIF